MQSFKNYLGVIFAFAFGSFSHVIITAVTRPGFSDDPEGMLKFGIDTVLLTGLVYLLIPTFFINLGRRQHLEKHLVFTVSIYILWSLAVLLFFAFHRDVLSYGVRFSDYANNFWYVKQHWGVIWAPAIAGVGYWYGCKVRDA